MQLDLSTNFLREFPSDALRHLTELKFLNVSNNLIDVSNDLHFLENFVLEKKSDTDHDFPSRRSSMGIYQL